MDLLCPILGDEVYGSKGRVKNLKSTVLRNIINKLERVALHAHKLELLHPKTNEPINVNVQSIIPI